MTRVNANVFRQALLLWSLIVLPSVVFGDAGHDVQKAPVAMEGMDHGDVQGHTSPLRGGEPRTAAEDRTPKKAAKMKMDGQDGAAVTSGHWMAPTEAARRGNPIPADSVSRERGRRLFEANCASCHGPTGRGNGPIVARLETLPPDLTAKAGQHPDGDFAWKIAEGRGSMPAWKGVLKDAEIWDLVNYIQNLGQSDGSQRGHAHAH